LGFGTVGSAVARRLLAAEPGTPSNIQLTHVFDRRAGEKRTSLRADDVVWTSSIDEVLHSGADIVVEALGGIEPAAGWIGAALLAGKSVVTANKQVVARHGAALLTLAARQGRQLRFEAAVGGAMPIVRAIGEGLAGDRITRLVAILNGTTNAVLSRMDETGCALNTASDTTFIANTGSDDALHVVSYGPDSLCCDGALPSSVARWLDWFVPQLRARLRRDGRELEHGHQLVGGFGSRDQ
jgi:homoserine dehydrogenase